MPTWGPKPVVTFLLVHGTFAHDADWVHDDSDETSFRSKMRAELGEDHEVRFDIISWGHRGCFRRLMDNTDSRRLYGVGELTRRLLECDDASAFNQRYIVAHSHGGNIVLGALRDAELCKKVTGVICLSSPFLVHGLAKFSRSILGLSCLSLIAPILGGWISAWIYAAFYIAIVATIIVKGKAATSLEDVIERRGLLTLAGREQFAGGTAGPSFLAIRPRRDEVTSLFWFTRGVGTFFRWLWNLLNGVGGVLVSVFVLLAILLDEFPQLAGISWLNDTRSLLGNSVLQWLMIVATFVLSVVVVMRWSYAFDAVPWVASMDVRSRIVPWDDAQVKVAPVFGWFKHTSIQNQSPPIIARWVRSLPLSAQNPSLV